MDSGEDGALPLKRSIGKLGSILLATFTMAVLAAILLRALRADGSIIVADIQHYAFAALIVFAIFAAFLGNRHIKADLFVGQPSKNQKIRFEIFWTLTCIVAPMSVLFYFVLPAVITSWQLYEGSREFGGLPGYFVVKSLLPLLCMGMIFYSALKCRHLIRSSKR